MKMNQIQYEINNLYFISKDNKDDNDKMLRIWWTLFLGDFELNLIDESDYYKMKLASEVLIEARQPGPGLHTSLHSIDITH